MRIITRLVLSVAAMLAPTAALRLSHAQSSCAMRGPQPMCRTALRMCAVEDLSEPLSLPSTPLTKAAPESLFPAWPDNVIAGKRDLKTVLAAFEEATVTVPLRASSEPGDGWRAWLDGGYAAHRFINQKLSRQTYLPTLSSMRMMVAIQAAYPDLYAVVKFVPKKNGLNPLLAELLNGADPDKLRIDALKPREVRRQLDDLKRALEQSWLLIGCYLTLPGKPEREDLLWSARTVVEKVKTDQRSRSLELLCLGFFHRDAALYPLVVVEDAESGSRRRGRSRAASRRTLASTRGRQSRRMRA